MIELNGITRSFGDRQVLDDVTFSVAGGRMTGFVGGNGAGKTTTMRIILGVLAQGSGTVTLDGQPITAGDRSRFGYMPEERGLYPKMKVAEQLVYLGKLHGLSAAAAKSEVDGLLERLGLAERGGDTLESLSLGNQQRAQIAAALVHDPKVLILDEPFSGLDPLAVDVVASVLQERASRGTAVLFSSHQLDVVERLCDDLVIIAGGRVAASGERDELRARYSGNRWSLQASADLGWVREHTGVDVAELAGTSLLFDADAKTADAVLRAALDLGAVVAFGPVRPTLGEIFRDVVTDSTNDEQEKEAAA